MFWAISS
jgi:hypothetical protein